MKHTASTFSSKKRESKKTKKERKRNKIGKKEGFKLPKDEKKHRKIKGGERYNTVLSSVSFLGLGRTGGEEGTLLRRTLLPRLIF